MFGWIMKIILENIFKCLVGFWKCYFPTNFSHFFNNFLSFQTTNFVIENFNNKLKRNKNQNKTFIELKNLVKRREREEERVIDNWGKGRGRSRKREIGHGCNLVDVGVWWEWCDLGLGVVVRSGVGYDGVIWSCGVRDLAGSTLFSWFGSFFSFLFYFILFYCIFYSRNGLKVSLEMGFGPWGGTIWAGWSLAGVSLDMGFGPYEECAQALSL